MDDVGKPDRQVNNPPKHAPNRLSKYIGTHEKVLGELAYQGAVVSDNLELEHYGDGKYVIEGDIILRNSVLVLSVLKTLETVGEMDGDPRVRTIAYSYNVRLPGVGVVFRYDSPHNDHHQFHHRHQYYPFSDNPEYNDVVPSSDGNWPLLSEVITEADKWYWDNETRLIESAAP